MFDDTQPADKIVLAMLKLAEAGNWRDLSLADIAEEAGVGLSELRTHFASKGAILAAYLRAVDDTTLETFGRYEADERVRDRVFDVLMTRFDVMAPHKASFQGLVKSPSFMPELIRPALSSIRWMVEAAGLATDGPMGSFHVANIGSVFQRAFNVWLRDDDPGQAKTMAALDKGLRNAERRSRSIEDAGAAVRRVADALRMDGGWWTGRASKRATAKPGAGSSEQTSAEKSASDASPLDDVPPSIH